MDDDDGFNSLSIIYFFSFTMFLNIFSSENEINIKDTEKSLITKFLGLIAKK